jgi:hypothetical protein
MLAGEVGNPRTLLVLSQIRHTCTTFVFIESYDSHGWLINSFKTPVYPRFAFNSIPGINHTGANSQAAGCTISFADGHAIFWEYADPRTSRIVAGGALSAVIAPSNGNNAYVQGPGGAPNSPDVYQLEAWSGGPVPPGACQ